MQCETSVGHLRDVKTFKYTVHPSQPHLRP